jgi:ferritin-like metal-binding protein YciE
MMIKSEQLKNITMDKIIDLKDLLKHEILDLYSAEEQIIESLPSMIEKAARPELKEALTSHLEVTKAQKDRLDQIKKVIIGGDSDEEDKGFFSNLFGGSNKVTCKGIEGLINEAERLMDEDMTPEAMDAAIIGAAQKIEHYEIAAYGTARAYASELKQDFVVTELEKTLHEEYDADGKLTQLAVGKINPDAENAVAADTEDDTPVDDEYQRLTNSVSIMSSSESDRYEAE